ncbi:MAG: DNA primase [Anaerolineales bacterium]|nr:DNA primase [Anaerolineales bacterium]MBS3753073.1 DNA primase [Anaerolineales bacterium]
MSVTDEIKDRIDIVDLVSESVELRHSGKNYSGYCPFHHNVNTPAFAVFPDTQTWHCFGECDDGGDVFNFVMKKEGWDFQEALQYLAERAGVTLKPLTPQEKEKKEEYERLRILLEDAVNFYRHNLLKTEAGKEARAYLHGRDITDETIETFGLGYAPDSWEAAGEYFQSKGYTEEELLQAGLVSERDSGGVYDRFRSRVMFPIRDRRGRIAGFGARVLDPEDVPKYLNSPQTPLFDKRRLLYGLDQARKAIRSEDEVVIVEGYMGVILPHQHGYHNVVATMGTALTDDHLRKVKRYTKRIILAMDSDAAGVKATLRGLEVARESLDRTQDLVFDARGLLHREARLRADLRVATLPSGMDPDDVVNRDPEGWQQIISQANPIVTHVMETLAEGRNLEDPKVKNEVASQVLPLIEDVPSAIERDTYQQRLARILEVDERTLLGYFPQSSSSSRSRRARYPGAPPQRPRTERDEAPLHRKGDLYEAHCVGILLHDPELLYRVDRQLGKAGLERCSEKDFQNTNYQIMIKTMKEALRQNQTEPNSFVMDHLSGDLLEVAHELLENSMDLNPRADKVLEDLMRAFLSLRKWRVLNRNSHLRYLMETTQENGDMKASQFREAMIQNLKERKKIDQAMNRYTSRTAALREYP